jgi:hypothetical protein
MCMDGTQHNLQDPSGATFRKFYLLGMLRIIRTAQPKPPVWLLLGVSISVEPGFANGDFLLPTSNSIIFIL